jgi:hypothetical protein
VKRLIRTPAVKAKLVREVKVRAKNTVGGVLVKDVKNFMRIVATSRPPTERTRVFAQETLRDFPFSEWDGGTILHHIEDTDNVPLPLWAVYMTPSVVYYGVRPKGRKTLWFPGFLLRPQTVEEKVAAVFSETEGYYRE